MSSHFVAETPGEMTTYLGWPLLFVLGVGGVTLLRRRLLFWMLVATGTLAFLASLGPRLIIENRKTRVPLPGHCSTICQRCRA